MGFGKGWFCIGVHTASIYWHGNVGLRCTYHSSSGIAVSLRSARFNPYDSDLRRKRFTTHKSL